MALVAVSVVPTNLHRLSLTRGNPKKVSKIGPTTATATAGTTGGYLGTGAVPVRTVEARDAYQDESDVLKQYLADNVAKEDGVCVRCSVLYDHYGKWCWRHKEQPEKEAAVGRRIREMFGVASAQKKIDRVNVRVYPGLRLQDPDALEVDYA